MENDPHNILENKIEKKMIIHTGNGKNQGSFSLFGIWGSFSLKLFPKKYMEIIFRF